MTIEDKIAALLAKAEATNFPEEAEAFMAKAEELMLKHGVERAMLESRRPGSKKQEIITRRVVIRNGHGYADAMMTIGFAAAPSFSVKALKSNLSDGSRILWLIGYTGDVNDVEALVASLMEQSRSQALHWWKTEGKHSYRQPSDNDAYLARREFIYAFASGVRARLEETRSRVVDSAPGSALVLVDRSKAVDEWIDANMEVGEARPTSRRSGGYEARIAGKQAGREAVTSKALK